MSVGRRSTLEIVSTATVTGTDVVSNVGGILGLFLGASFVNAWELVYLATAGLLRGRGGGWFR